jgi:microsomal dipeptidase-like Zn-dependent dipeptidase
MLARPTLLRIYSRSIVCYLTQGLLERGYMDDDVEIVLSDNFLRVYGKI